MTSHLYPMYMGWAIRFTAINLKTWNRITPEVQSFLLDQFKQYEDRYWDFMDQTTKDAENCNVGKQPCTMGNVLNLQLVTVQPEEAGGTQADHGVRGAERMGRAAPVPMPPRSGMQRSARFSV